jgi:hypothetical protein
MCERLRSEDRVPSQSEFVILHLNGKKLGEYFSFKLQREA